MRGSLTPKAQLNHPIPDLNCLGDQTEEREIKVLTGLPTPRVWERTTQFKAYFQAESLASDGRSGTPGKGDLDPGILGRVHLVPHFTKS